MMTVDEYLGWETSELRLVPALYSRGVFDIIILTSKKKSDEYRSYIRLQNYPETDKYVHPGACVSGISVSDCTLQWRSKTDYDRR